MSEVGDDEYLWAHCYHTGENKLIFQDLCVSQNIIYIFTGIIIDLFVNYITIEWDEIKEK